MRNHWFFVAGLSAAAALPWTIGGYAVYVTTPQFTGLGLLQSYQAFQDGSNLGNVIWFVLWSTITVATCWVLGRKSSGISGPSMILVCLLLAYAAPAVLLLLPDAAMGFAVSHVRAFSDDTAPHSSVVDFFVVSGCIAAFCALVLFVISRLAQRSRGVLAGGR